MGRKFICGKGSLEYDSGKKMAKLALDYSHNISNGWSQTGMSFTDSEGIDYSGSKVLNIELYYNPKDYKEGDITVKVDSQDVFQEQMSAILGGKGVKQKNGMMQVDLSFEINSQYAKTEKPQTLMVVFAGNNTDFKGNIYIKKIELAKEREEKYLVNSTKKVKSNVSLSDEGSALKINGTNIDYDKTVQIADSEADENTIATYQYLSTVGKSTSTIYGHMNDTCYKAGSDEFTSSDTKDITGSISGIVGFESADSFSDYADKYNKQHKKEKQLNPEVKADCIKGAALLTNEAIKEGAIITLGSHMPNFSMSIKNKGDKFDHTYDAYDFGGSTFNETTGDCMNEIMPGGKYNEIYTAYLDTIVDYAKQVEGTILYRPFHENTGSWFWWGADFCEPEVFKNVYRYTEEYIESQGVHNILYVYSTGTEPSKQTEVEERYPGDEYVDIIGFDTYDLNPISDEESKKLTGGSSNTGSQNQGSTGAAGVNGAAVLTVAQHQVLIMEEVPTDTHSRQTLKRQ